MASRCTCMVLLALLAFATYTVVSSSAEPLLVRGSSSSNNRKLAQWYGRNYGAASRQAARNSAAISNTQWAIRSAVEAGGVFPATADATYYGADQAYRATQRWYPYRRWYGGR